MPRKADSLKWIRKIFRRRSPVTPVPAPTPDPTGGRFYDGFMGGLGQWSFETGAGFNGDQEYTSNGYTAAPDGLRLIATPDRRSVRLISHEAPFGRGTRLTYLAALDRPQRAVWPALWAVGKSLDWPRCGEIDVMECGLDGHWGIKQTVHTADTYARYGEHGDGPNAVIPPIGVARYTAEWRDDDTIRFAVNGAQTGIVKYTATEPLRLVMNVALRKGVPLDQPWRMIVKEVTVEPL